MSGGKACACEEKREPLTPSADKPNRPGRLWRVIQYRCNHSAFSGYHRTPSRYSSVECLRCGAHWRTMAPYADSLHSPTEDEKNISRGYARHADAMEARGRTPHQ